MGARQNFAVLVFVASSLLNVQCDVGCKGTDGRPGEAGTPGRDGLSGLKGEKGEPAAMVDGPADQLRLKGDPGSPGPPGDMGLQGYKGQVGPTGPVGQPGPSGPAGKNTGSGQDSSNQEAQYSAFSVIRNESSYPSIGQKITYQTVVVNKPGDFQTNTGHFVCRVSGIYYFTFHSVAKVSMCLGLGSDSLGDEKLVFCDYNSNRRFEQVLSGGAVLQLAAGEKVWLESFKDLQTESDKRDKQEKYIIFNGFLLFSNPE